MIDWEACRRRISLKRKKGLELMGFSPGNAAPEEGPSCAVGALNGGIPSLFRVSMLARRHRAPIGPLLHNRPRPLYSSPLFQVIAKQNQETINRFGVVVGVGVDPRSTERHRLRRILFTEVRSWPPLSSDFVFIIGREARNTSAEVIRRELKRALVYAKGITSSY